jgi:hypothetical protein
LEVPTRDSGADTGTYSKFSMVFGFWDLVLLEITFKK